MVITDLYTPGQDPGDNFDILTPYSLENIDLKAVVFDVSEMYRKDNPLDKIWREPGYIPVTQLNYLFDVDVPCGCAPFEVMRSEDDAKWDAPAFQTKGIDLLFEVLENSDRPVHIVSTGSCRPLAVAYNRNPELMCSDKVATVHICAGSSSDKFHEWNIVLDPIAAARVFRSGMNMAIYPCGIETGAETVGRHNTFWGLKDLTFILDMDPHLRNYSVYSILSKDDIYYLNYLDVPLSAEDEEELRNYWRSSALGNRHHVWETAVWQQVAGLNLVTHPDGTASLLPSDQIKEGDVIFDEGLEYIDIDVRDDGIFYFEHSDEPTNVRLYYRSEPQENERLLNMALPRLYKSYKSNMR